ncbi:MAG TPA: hypothetical protein VMN76_08865 [Acidobacteriota bacterium]|nr:hypothetical protein [Acidobacteriota bacterium]
MLFQDVDALRGYVEKRKVDAERLRWSPPAVFWRGRWRRIAGFRYAPGGVELRLRGGGSCKLFGSRTAPGRRTEQPPALLSLVGRLFRPLRALRVLGGNDRLRHQSAAFLRILMGRARPEIAVAAVFPGVSQVLVHRLLASVALWWDSLQGRGLDRVAVLIPGDWGERLLRLLEHLAIPLECFRYRSLQSADCTQVFPREVSVSAIDPAYVVYPFQGEAGAELSEIRDRYPDLDLLFRSSHWELSFRGLPVAWEDDGVCWFHFFQPLEWSGREWGELDRHLAEVARCRSFPPPDPAAAWYRFMPERWLEGEILKKRREIDATLGDTFYCQVPSFLDGERGVLDILTAEASGTPVVMEIKVEKSLEIVFQGLEYRDRVKEHVRRGDLVKSGYFAESPIAATDPKLKLVTPLFEVHRVVPVIRKHLRGVEPMEWIGVNSNWKRRLRVLNKTSI